MPAPADCCWDTGAVQPDPSVMDWALACPATRQTPSRPELEGVIGPEAAAVEVLEARDEPSTELTPEISWAWRAREAAGVLGGGSGDRVLGGGPGE